MRTSCSSKPAAAIGILTSTSHSAWVACMITACLTGGIRPIRNPISIIVASRRCVARYWAARLRSMLWPTRAAIAAITTAGRKRARAVGPTPTCCPTFCVARLLKRAPTLGEVAAVLSALNSRGRATLSTKLGLRPGRPPAIRSTRIIMVGNRKALAAASTRSVTDGAHHPQTPSSSPRVDAKISLLR